MSKIKYQGMIVGYLL